MLLSTFLENNSAAFIVTMAILGLVVGSFLNVVIYRLPVILERDWRTQCRTLLGIKETAEEDTTEPFNLVTPRSRCPKCGKMITAIYNIPIISFLCLKGKCAYCKQPISGRYPSVELLTGILTALVAWKFGYHPQFIFSAILIWSLICLTFIDFDHQILPDDITLPILWLGIICNIFSLFTDIYSSLFGAIFGYGVLWLIFMLYKMLTGKEGMGYGDFKLLAMIGAWLGWQMLPLIILISSILGATIGVLLIVYAKHGKNIPIPFGPYLAIAGCIALFWGRDIMHFYLNFL